MKLLKLSLLAVLLSVFAACGGDDESAGDCVQADWVGTYTGTKTLAGVADEDVTVTITASGSDAVIVKYETATIEAEFDPYTPDGCDIDESQTALGLGLTVEATLDGDNLTFKDITSAAGVDITCSITATRQ